MPYLLDSNTLIQAKNDYYAFDVCPGFWDWIDETHAAGQILSIDRVRRELEQGRDELAEWAVRRGPAFFLADDDLAVDAMRRVSSWVEHGDFQDRAKREFLDCADPFLIAYAIGHGHTVVTHEVHVEGQRNKVKIPTVCRGLGVPCERTFDVLRRLGAVFVQRPAGVTPQGGRPPGEAGPPAAAGEDENPGPGTLWT